MPSKRFERQGSFGPVAMAALALAYLATALLGFRLSVPGTNATAVWIPTGLALAAVLRFGPRVWPGIFLGAFLANGLQAAPLGLHGLPLVGLSLVTAAGNTAEALLAGHLLERFAGTRQPFDSGPHVLTFLGAVLPSTALSALVGTTAFCAATGRWELFSAVGGAWWVGDGVGALVVAPLLLTFSRQDLAGLPLRAHLEALAVAASLLLLWFQVCSRPPYHTFILLPLMVLTAVWLGPFYAAALVALLATLATGSLAVGAGPFLRDGPREGALLIQQGYIGTLAITTLVLAAVFAERKSLEDRLRLRNRLYRTLSAVDQAIAHAEERGALLREACRLLVEVGGFRMAWVGFKDEASGRLRPEASAGFVGGYLDGIDIRWDESPAACGPTGQALRADQGVIFPDSLKHPAFAPWRAAAQALGYRTSGAFPIRQGGRVTGALMIYHTEPHAISPEDGHLLEELAGDLGKALEALETRMGLRESERRLRTTLENVALLAVTLEADGTLSFCNDFMLRLTGWSREEVLGRSWFEVFLPPDVRAEVEAVFAATFQSGALPLHYENEILTRTGARRRVRWNNTILYDPQGAILGTFSLGEDITDQRQAEHLLNGQKQVLEMTASGAPLPETLAVLVRLMEALSPGMVGSILLLDEDGLHLRHGAAPSLPAAYMAAVDGLPIGPCAGSCGTAAYRKEAVIVEDIATDPLWADYRAAALPHGLRACWSTPIFDGQRQVLGLFAMYFRQPARPQAEHHRIVEIATQTAALAIGKHRADAILRATHAELDSYFANSLDLLCIADLDGHFRRLNAEWERTLGYPLAELQGQRFLDFVHPEDVPATVAAMARLSSREHILNFCNRYRHRDGTYRWIEWRAYAADRLIYAVARDITERQQAEDALTQRAAQLAALNALGTALSTTPMDLAVRARVAVEQTRAALSPDLALLFLREEGKLQLLASAEGTGGIHHAATPEHVVGQCLCGLAVQEARPLYALDITRDLRCTWTECKEAGVKSFAVLPLLGDGEVIGALGVASAVQRDFLREAVFLETLADQVGTGLHNALLHVQIQARASELERRVEERTAQMREANKDLALAVEHAEYADRAKSAFLAAMSHELRTPLNSVIGFTGVLLGGMLGELSEKQIEPLRIVQRNGRHLLDLINDVLDLSKIEAGEFRLAHEPFDLVQVLRESLEALAPLATLKELALETRFAVETLDWTGDRRRVAQVLLNLLGNAVKFTERGTVTLELALEAGWARIAVRDTGPGLAEQDLPRLFQEFVQLDGGLARRKEGTGLGLALSRRLARLMNGNITVASRLGEGSTFTFSLPLPAGEGTP